jgi:hypothetical protein
MKEAKNLQEQQRQALNIPVVIPILFLCDVCGKEKSSKKYPVLDENWNKQNGLNQCEDCFEECCT